MCKRILITLLVTSLACVQTFAQVQVSGKVVDSKGESVIGASVLIEGTTTGTMTDLDGTYSITVPTTEAVLVFQFIGYGTQKFTVGNKTTIDVTMAEDAELLEDVVVVAYGTSKRKDLTGSIGTINNENIVAQAQGSVTRALEGQVAGLQTTAVDGQPGLDMGIRIRGIGTASANNSNALIIVDGVPATEGTNPLASINGKDIESITVLKDAASTALYGARGANGVVLVTTKTGKQGKAKISFEARLGVNAIGPNATFDKVGDGNVGELYEFYWQSIYNDIYYGKGTNTGGMAGNADAAATFASQHLFDYAGKVGTYERNGLGNKMAYNVPGAVYNLTGNLGTTSQSATMTGAYLVNEDGRINPNAELIWGDSDVYNSLVSNRLRQEYNVSASGASDKIDYHISLGYLSDPSYIKVSSFERYTARANVNAQVTKWLKAGANFGYTRRDTKSQSTRSGRNPGYTSQNVFTFIGVSSPLDHMYALDKNGDYILNSNGEKMVNLNYGRDYPNTTNSYSPLGYVATPWNFNIPLFFDQSEYKQAYNDLAMKGYVRATFLKYFNFEANLAYDKTFETLTRFWNTESAHDMNGLSSSFGSAIRKEKNEYSVLNSQLMLNYNQDFGKHHVDALLGHEYYQYDFEKMYWSGAHTLLNDSQAYVNYLGTASYSTFSSNGGAGGDLEKLAMESYLARVNYIYDEKYYVSGSVRRDGSSKFKTTSTRWGTFWSVGLGWRITSEPWMQGAQKWLSNLKIRGSYGVLGNQNGVNNYSGYQTWTYSGSNWIAGRDTYPQTYNLSKDTWVNDNLTWENVETADAGFDFTLWGGMLAGSFDWFSKHTKNAIWNKNVSYLAAGQSTIVQNTAGIKSTGVEFDLSYQPVKTKNWDVVITANGTHYKTILTSIPEGAGYTYEAAPDTWTSAGVNSVSWPAYLRGEGKNYYNLYLYKYGGVAGNPDKRYFGTDGQWHSGYTTGDVDAGNALFWHKITGDEAKKGTYGSGYKEGDDILVADSGKASRYELGDALPKLYGGFSGSMRYKGLDFSMQFAYQIGGKYIAVDYSSPECGKYMTGENLRNGTAISQELVGNTWSENNLYAKFPMNYYSASITASGANAATGGQLPTDLCVFDASYLSVKNITIGYTFPSKWMDKAKIANLRLYLSADNVFLLTSHSGYDPRRSMTGALEVGVFSYPYLSTYTFGVNLDF